MRVKCRLQKTDDKEDTQDYRKEEDWEENLLEKQNPRLSSTHRG